MTTTLRVDYKWYPCRYFRWRKFSPLFRYEGLGLGEICV